MRTYNFILQGEDATQYNALSAISGLDWSEMEVQESNVPRINLDYVDTKEGIEIYYDFAGDYYLFSPVDN